MGIAGFFLWLKQYYAQCIDNIPQSVVDDALQHKASPDSVATGYRYDNLYIDMNGLLHPCCHDTYPLPEPKDEEEMFSRLFDQLDLLVKVVRPRKCLVLCVDGVAPRSKMNQQRVRRFHGVEDRAVSNQITSECADAIEKDLHLPRPEVNDKWDHNVITPATVFMDRMAQAVEWYVLKKLNDDPAWQEISVVFSDAHVPGEGEHKIMQYIRGLRSQPGYHPSTSHVIHGMDADLICLGLSLHEEHVSILRNQLTETFQPDHNRFCYFNLHTYREALKEDFANITDMDFERVLDDFVYLCFFVGNDFLPHIPLISIKTQGIELLLDHYVRQFDDHGYLTHGGSVDFGRLSRFLKNFVEKSMEKLRTAYHGVERGKRRATLNVEERILKTRRTLGKLKQIALAKTTDAVDGEGDEEEAAPRKTKGRSSKYDLYEEEEDDDEYLEEPELGKAVAEAKGMSRAALAQHILGLMTDIKKEQARFVADRQPLPFSYLTDNYREKYYRQKFGWNVEEDAAEFERNVHKCCAEYLRGTQWVMWYYTHGCPSWEWFYPYHYAPLVQDLAAFQGEVDVQMNMSAPLHPFEQLLAVLPRESVHGLPTVFHQPVLDRRSVLSQFYPDKVDIDFTEAYFSYQGVLRLPFIDCKALHKAVGKIAILEPDRAITLVLCHAKSALAQQVKRHMPQLLATANEQASHTARIDSNGGDGEDETARRRRMNAENDTALLPISRDVAGRVPLAGRIGPCPADRSWPMHAKITCPDAGLAEKTPYGQPIEDNEAYVFRYEMEDGGTYRAELLGPGGTTRLNASAHAGKGGGSRKKAALPHVARSNGAAKRPRSPPAAEEQQPQHEEEEEDGDEAEKKEKPSLQQPTAPNGDTAEDPITIASPDGEKKRGKKRKEKRAAAAHKAAAEGHSTEQPARAVAASAKKKKKGIASRKKTLVVSTSEAVPSAVKAAKSQPKRRGRGKGNSKKTQQQQQQ